MKLVEIIDCNLAVYLSQLTADIELVIDIQKQLNAWGLYPTADSFIDGEYGLITQQALSQFFRLQRFKNLTKTQIDQTSAICLLNPNADILIETATNNEQVFKVFFDSQFSCYESQLRFRDSLIDNSPFYNTIVSYPHCLTQQPDNIEVVSAYFNHRRKTATANTHFKPIFEPYPDRGQIPNIEENNLSFLHDDVTQACICIGNFVDGEISTRWLGKKALTPVQFWSSTKFIALLNLASQLYTQNQTADLDNCVIKSCAEAQGIPLIELMIDMMSYNCQYGSSNSIAAMFKRFNSYDGLDTWMKSMTGNDNLSFKGKYGEKPFYLEPQLYDQKLNQAIVTSQPEKETGANLVSAYDLTRLITMLGWHYHLNSSARIASAKWYSLSHIIRGLGYDRARYLDFAIKRLGLQSVIKDVVILSKVGWGDSDERNCYEIVYTAFVQFID